MKLDSNVTLCTTLFTETLASLGLAQSYSEAVAALSQAIFLWALGKTPASPEQLEPLGGPFVEPAWQGKCPAVLQKLMVQLEALSPSEAELGLSLEALHWQQKTGAERGRGIYYTPPSLARFMARLALVLYRANLPRAAAGPRLPASFTLYDPAVGTGAFLTAALEQLNFLPGLLQPGTKTSYLLTLLAGQDVDEVAIYLTKVRLWLQVLAEVREGSVFPPLPRLTVGDSLQGPPLKADLVLANPPYRRQEGIDPATKNFLWDQFQGKVPRQADLYSYFLANLTSILKPGGVAAVVTPVAWLEVDYGLALQGLLQRELEIPLIIGTAHQRWFEKAAVHTAISSFVQPPAGSKPKDATRLVNLKVPIQAVPPEQLASVTDQLPGFKDRGRWQEVTLPYRQLRALTQKRGPVRANWGTMLRAPAAYFVLHGVTPGAWTRVGRLGTIRRGFTSGANAFFFVRDLTDTARGEKMRPQFGLATDSETAIIAAGTRGETKYFAVEREFLRPLIKSPREVKGCLVDEKQLGWKVLLLPPDEDYINNCKVAAYIRWGRTQGFHLRPTTKTRLLWWSLPQLPPPQVLARQFYHRRFNFPYNPRHILCDHTFYYLTDCAAPELVAALLNSTLTLFQVELWGRSNMGDGVLTCYGSELADLPMVKPTLFSPQQQCAVIKCFRRLCRRVVLPLEQEVRQTDRKELDLLLLSALGITGFPALDLLEKIYTEFCQLVDQRQQRSQISTNK